MLRRNEPMAKHTTLRVGGPADVYVEPATEADFGQDSEILQRARLKVFHFRSWVEFDCPRRRLSRRGDLSFAQLAFAEIEVVGNKIFAGAGAKSKDLAVAAKRAGLSGVEFLEGIPGSIGGALRMNAGAMGGETFNAIESVRVMDFGGNVRELKPSEMAVSYRSCVALKNHVAFERGFPLHAAHRARKSRRG
jgi:UDP-N-acetylenolpyruvoylglucosamine reductase